jgi:hypothetical protein
LSTDAWSAPVIRQTAVEPPRPGTPDLGDVLTFEPVAGVFKTPEVKRAASPSTLTLRHDQSNSASLAIPDGSVLPENTQDPHHLHLSSISSFVHPALCKASSDGLRLRLRLSLRVNLSQGARDKLLA